MKKIPFSKPWFPEDDIPTILEEIKQILVSGWLSLGKHMKQFEEEFSNVVGVKNSITMNSATAALHASLLALDVKDKEVIVPSNTFVATANAVVHAGGIPVFVDSDPETYCMSSESVNKKINERTGCIIPVHLGGNPCDMNNLLEIANEKNIPVVEDSAHALGSSINGKKCGSFGVCGCFSFYPSKLITTGEGGMVTTDDDVIAEKIRKIRNQGREGIGYPPVEYLGHNFRLPEISCLLGLYQLKRLDEFIENRQKIVKIYNNFLKTLDSIHIQKSYPNSFNSHYAYLIKITDKNLKRDHLIKHMNKLNIGHGIHYHPIHLQPYYQRLGYHDNLPVAEDLGENGIALPIYNYMKTEEAKRVA